MRTEQEMLALLTAVAEEDPRIRAAYLEGSRANPKAPKDIFQDYDVVYVVEDTAPFRADRSWIDRFGERLYMQYPEEGVLFPAQPERCYGWLMQLRDGNRLDLHVCTPAYALENLELYRTLLDKDGLMPGAAEISDEIYWIGKPTEEEFRCVCNEFWWCLNNVAKGLWRGELPYALDMLDFTVRPMLKRLLTWQAGLDHDFKVSAGKAGKYLGRLLSPEEYALFLSTYAPGEERALWQATLRMCDQFHRVAQAVSAALGYPYDGGEAAESRGFLERVRELPRDARSIF